jgi:peptidoglycan-associated lipoprotein
MTTRAIERLAIRLGAVLLTLTVVGCGHAGAPVVRPTPPAPPSAADGGENGGANAGNRPSAPAEPLAESVIIPPEPVTGADLNTSASLDELNRSSPLKPVYFELDSSDISPDAQKVLDENAALLRRQAGWTVTIEGHCDERGSAEYNLALGERRALAARAYLVSLGLSGERLRIVSYGREFPFDPGHDESAFSKNRRAHFVITAK